MSVSKRAVLPSLDWLKADDTVATQTRQGDEALVSAHVQKPGNRNHVTTLNGRF